MPKALLLTALVTAAFAAAVGACAAGEAGERLADAETGTPAQPNTEPMVAPVKRVAPKTPVFTHGAASGSVGKSSAGPVVPSRPDCDSGFKVDESGKRCIKVARRDAGKTEKKTKNR